MADDQPKREIHRVNPKRLAIGSGDISLSYSAKQIATGRPIRQPFQHAAELWICTDMRSANTGDSGLDEFEAYRLTPVDAFDGKTMTFKARTGSGEAQSAAKADPQGLYHGVIARHGSATFALRGPPASFVAREITKRRKTTSPSSDPQQVDTAAAPAEPPVETGAVSSASPCGSEYPIRAVPASRLHQDRGDISGSYSADRIGMDQPIRHPFKCDGALWVCTGITGSGLAASGSAENEAYRLVPEQMFTGAVTSYNEKTGTAEGAEAARSDPSGFYHGMKVKFASTAFVLCGPPTHFIAERPDPVAQEPAQLTLF